MASRYEKQATRSTRSSSSTASSEQQQQPDFLSTFRWWHLLDINQPWILTPSFGGHFDWVPIQFRVGPWSVVAQCYFFLLWYVAVLVGCYNYYVSNKATINHESEQMLDYDPVSLLQDYPTAYSPKWYYHALATAWMLYIVALILFQSPLGYRAWCTFTVLSWTLLALRHGLCAALPWHGGPTLIAMVEWMRFPCALSHTVVFLVWNFVLTPYLSLVVLASAPQRRRAFLQFCTSFRLLNLHGANMILCVLNVYWASPPRRLGYADLYVTLVGILLYMTFYLTVLDRLGVHLYPIFSPRVGKVVAVSWTGSIALYLMTFVGWQKLLQPTELHQ